MEVFHLKSGLKAVQKNPTLITFTQFLIKAGTLVKNGRKNIMDINEAFLIAKEDVKAKYNQQNPDKAYAPVKRDTWFPFALKIDLFQDFS